MANFNLYFPIEEKAEGIVYENVQGDSGGCTKFGLTLQDLIDYYNDKTKTCNDVKLLDAPKASLILKKIYWDYFFADQIPNESLAEFIVDAGLNQGKPLITIYLQKLLDVEPDGKWGKESLKALLAHSASDTFTQLYSMRKKRYDNIVAEHSIDKKFYAGWINRLNLIHFS